MIRKRRWVKNIKWRRENHTDRDRERLKEKKTEKWMSEETNKKCKQNPTKQHNVIEPFWMLFFFSDYILSSADSENYSISHFISLFLRHTNEYLGYFCFVCFIDLCKFSMQIRHYGRYTIGLLSGFFLFSVSCKYNNTNTKHIFQCDSACVYKCEYDVLWLSPVGVLLIMWLYVRFFLFLFFWFTNRETKISPDL